MNSTQQEPVVVVSSDAHVGPSLVGDLRPYCEAGFLGEFDVYARFVAESLFSDFEGLTAETAVELGRDPSVPVHARNARSGGFRDVYRRIDDLDFDGVAAEVVFHGSTNTDGIFETIPFNSSVFSDGAGMSGRERELAVVGRGIYNRWLADFCSVEPERHAGLCQVSIWDIESSVASVRWAAEHGLRGVNFPHPQAALPSYEDPSWDPFFAVCAELGMPLATHIGTSMLPPICRGAGMLAVGKMESAWISGRNLWHMIFSGVFDRHPGLKLAIIECPGTWWATTVREMEAVYDDTARGGPMLRRFLRRRPIEYVMDNVYFGASYQSRGEALVAVSEGLAPRVMWGSDYPHAEGTWHYPDGQDITSTTRLSLSSTFTGLAEPDVRRMAGGTAIECFGFDAAALTRVAQRIGPSLHELSTAPDLSLVPDDYVGLGFRSAGAWH